MIRVPSHFFLFVELGYQPSVEWSFCVCYKGLDLDNSVLVHSCLHMRFSLQRCADPFDNN